MSTNHTELEKKQREELIEKSFQLEAHKRTTLISCGPSDARKWKFFFDNFAFSLTEGYELNFLKGRLSSTDIRTEEERVQFRKDAIQKVMHEIAQSNHSYLSICDYELHTWDPRDIELVFDILASCRLPIRLTLPQVSLLIGPFVRCFYQGIEKCRSSITLELGFNEFLQNDCPSHEASVALFLNMLEHSTVVNLSFIDTFVACFNDQTIRIFAEGLKKAKCLKTFSMSTNLNEATISVPYLNILFKGLAESTIETLYLAPRDYRDYIEERRNAIIQGIAAIKSLKRLEFICFLHYFTDTAQIEQLFKGIVNSNSLETLYLSVHELNAVSDEGFEKIMAAFEDNTKVVIDFKPIYDIGVEDICFAERRTKIKNLKIKLNLIAINDALDITQQFTLADFFTTRPEALPSGKIAYMGERCIPALIMSFLPDFQRKIANWRLIGNMIGVINPADAEILKEMALLGLSLEQACSFRLLSGRKIAAFKLLDTQLNLYRETAAPTPKLPLPERGLEYLKPKSPTFTPSFDREQAVMELAQFVGIFRLLLPYQDLQDIIVINQKNSEEEGSLQKIKCLLKAVSITRIWGSIPAMCELQFEDEEAFQRCKQLFEVHEKKDEEEFDDKPVTKRVFS